MPRKLPERTCLGCGNRRPKREMIRIIRTPERTVEIDPTGKKSGRGAYVCPNQACVEQLKKNKRLERVLEVPLPPFLMQELSKIIDKSNADTRR
jgi:predicted RNA-binding protein YlxR (DUF448 family)